MTLEVRPVESDGAGQSHSPSECLEHVLNVPPPQQLLTDLRAIRNSVIGSRDRKSTLVMQGRIPFLVALLLYPFPASTRSADFERVADIRCLAAAILNSLAHSAPKATLHLLLQAQAHTYLQQSLTSLVELCQRPETGSSTESSQAYLKLLESLLRAQRALLLTLSEEISASPRWGVGAGWAGGPSSWAKPASRDSASQKREAQKAPRMQGATAGFRDPASAQEALKLLGVYTYEWRDMSPTPQVVVRLVPATFFQAHPTIVPEGSSFPQDADAIHFALARQAITMVFARDRLPLLLGPLFLAPLPPAIGSVTWTDKSNGRTSAPRSRNTTRPNSPSGRPLQAPSGSKGDPSLLSQRQSQCAALPLATRARLLSISEIVCGIVARCLSIPGLPPSQNDVGLPTRQSTREGKARVRDGIGMSQVDWDGVMWSNTSTALVGSEATERRLPTSPEDEITDRRSRVVEFVSSSSPFNTTSARRWLGLEAAFPNSAIDDGNTSERVDLDSTASLQAELLRKSGFEALDSGLLTASDVLGAILEAVESGYAKTQEAAMWALCELVRSNAQTCLRLFKKTTPSGSLPTSVLLSLRRDPSPSVRLAAFSCLAHIVRLHPFSHRTNLCVLEVLLDLLDEDNSTAVTPLEAPGSVGISSSTDIQIQAAFALAGLVEDEEILQMTACEDMNAMQRLVALLEKSAPAAMPEYVLSPQLRFKVDHRSPDATPFGSTGSASLQPTHIDESLIRLREGALTALAALAFRRDEIRRMFVDSSSPPLLPIVVTSLSAGAVGIRVAACRLVRSLSRAVAVLRTSLVDAGVAGRLLGMLKDEDEHPDVKTEATATICNLVVQFSPMRQMLLDAGAMEQLVQTAQGGIQRRGGGEGGNSDASASAVRAAGLGTARINALWALKNLLYASETTVKELVMRSFGWDNLLGILTDDDEDPAAREQALSIVRNLLCGRLRDADMTYEGLGRDKLLDVLEHVIWNNRDDAIVEQVAYIIVNIATGSEDYSRAILDRPNLLDALLFFLSHPRAEIREASLWALLNLTETPSAPSLNPPLTAAPTSAPTIIADPVGHAISRLRSFGFEDPVRRLVADEALDVRDRAKSLLIRFE